jgi:hypothetical protein
MRGIQDPALPAALLGGGVALGGYVFTDGTSVDIKRSAWAPVTCKGNRCSRCVAPIVRYDATSLQNLTYFWAAGGSTAHAPARRTRSLGLSSVGFQVITAVMVGLSLAKSG